jgi:hypothetical protein
LGKNFRLSRNLLKGQVGDEINVLMAACAWNLKKWLAIATILGLRLGLKNHQVGGKWVSNDCSYLCKGL